MNFNTIEELNNYLVEYFGYDENYAIESLINDLKGMQKVISKIKRIAEEAEDIYS